IPRCQRNFFINFSIHNFDFPKKSDMLTIVIEKPSHLRQSKIAFINSQLIMLDTLKEMQEISDSAHLETFTWGIPGLELVLLLYIHPTDGVILSPTDRWYTFSPHGLPKLATDIVRRYNLTGDTVKWMFWMPDTPDSLYEWRPEWDMHTKKYKPLSKIRCPQRMAPHRTPGWTQNIVEMFRHAWNKKNNK
ncbi:MAG TPA: hypothetical protein VIY47_02990, partial [Ignavibacteriaceae bacterium]